MKHDKIGTQVKLPMGRAVQIAVQGIRIRLGRSMVTVSGVVLGIAFLMSNVAGQLISDALSRERETRQIVTLMEALVRNEVGTAAGKTLAVTVHGDLERTERLFMERVAKMPFAAVRVSGANIDRGVSATPQNVAEGAYLLLVLGQQQNIPVDLETLISGMNHVGVLDAVANRTYAGQAPRAGVKRDLLFGKETQEQMERMREHAAQARFRTVWVAIISLLVTIISISNALLMSVTERIREIGTMKCLGALSAFIRRMFLIESAFIGFAGSLAGMVLGALIPLIIYGWIFGFGLMFGEISFVRFGVACLGCVVVGTLLAMIAAIYPANFAARMVPASALRSNV
ncbi:MAG: FtsX-like permease family protein [Lentisphaerae bacterium]|nr:FtsX-like permease family protein [Lentisphaerota bacterium]